MSNVKAAIETLEAEIANLKSEKKLLMEKPYVSRMEQLKAFTRCDQAIDECHNGINSIAVGMILIEKFASAVDAMSDENITNKVKELKA